MSAVRLSICIPVHNFGAFLGETLESICPQATDEVEVVVLDGGSTDDTPQVMARAQGRWPRLRYERLPAKGGIDRDMARVVALASGAYVWIFSGDDIMRPGAIARVLSELGSGCDVYLVESMLCTFDLRPLSLHRMARVDEPRTFRLHDPAERREYFRLALNTAAFFSFCSALVIARARWDAAPVDESYYGSCWAHAARVFGMLPGGLVVRYLPGALLDKRGDNDSFNTRGLAHRFGIAIDGYHRIAADFFGEGSAEAAHIRRAVRAEHPFTAWLLAKGEIGERGRWDQLPLLDRLVRKQNRGAPWVERLGGAVCRLAPARLLGALKRIRDRARAA